MQQSVEFLLKIFPIGIRLDCIARCSSAILQSAIQLTELRLCATAFKATIYQKFIHGKSTLPYSWKMRSQKWGYLKKKFWLRTMLQSARVDILTVCGRISPRIRKYFRVLTRGLGAIDLWKKQKSQISWDCFFKTDFLASKARKELLWAEFFSLLEPDPHQNVYIFVFYLHCTSHRKGFEAGGAYFFFITEPETNPNDTAPQHSSQSQYLNPHHWAEQLGRTKPNY
jgi:hypothetical protein